MIDKLNKCQFDEGFEFSFNEIQKNNSKFQITQKSIKKKFPSIDCSKLNKKKIKCLVYQEVWLKCNLETVKNYNVASKIFDFAFNIGIRKTSIILQRSLNAGWEFHLIVDGKISKKEINFINKINDDGESQTLKKIISHYTANYYEIFGDKNDVKEALHWIFK